MRAQAEQQAELFGERSPVLPRYPEAPGFKARETSRQAAEAIAPKAMSLRAMVFEEIKRRPSTPEEIAERLRQPVHNIRPRTSELSARCLIVDSGERREAMGGRRAIVWKAA